MKWIANKNEALWNARWEAMQDWHRWFAWRPVYISEGKAGQLTPAHWVWLEYVDRIYIPRRDCGDSIFDVGFRNRFRPYTDTPALPCKLTLQLS